MFKKYKLKFVCINRINDVHIVYQYIYKNCTICKSSDDSYLCISICPHGRNTRQLPLEKDEIIGILNHLGLNPDEYYRYSTIHHPYSLTQGNTHYYLQETSPIETIKDKHILVPNFF